MPTLLERKVAELDEMHGIVRDIQERAAREDRELTDIERDRIAAMGEAATKLRSECEFLNDQVKSERAWASLRADIDASREREPEPRGTASAGQPSRVGSGSGNVETRGWGDAFVESDAFKNYPGAGTSQRVSLPFDIETRAAISISTLPPQPPYQYTPATYNYATPLLNAVGKVTVNTNAVSWVQWTPNPQAAASVVAEGELKPEANMTATPVSDTLDTYAHWKAITRQALEDYGQIRSIVENRLRQGLVVALEGAVMAALSAATLPNVTGSAAAGDTMLSLVREGIAAVQAAGFARPNAVLINPSDAAGIDVAIMTGGLSGPVVNGTYWGVPVIPVADIPVGTSYIGDFSVAVQLFSRANAEVFMTDSHADYFVRNILVLLAEQRALATVPDPNAAFKAVLGA